MGNKTKQPLDKTLDTQYINVFGTSRIGRVRSLPREEVFFLPVAESAGKRLHANPADREFASGINGRAEGRQAENELPILRVYEFSSLTSTGINGRAEGPAPNYRVYEFTTLSS